MDISVAGRRHKGTLVKLSFGLTAAPKMGVSALQPDCQGSREMSALAAIGKKLLLLAVAQYLMLVYRINQY